MRRIARELEDVKAAYDVIVVGSGYGASIAASRLSRVTPGMSVCVLERGLERLPGEFPDNPFKAMEQMQIDVPNGPKLNRLGLFDFHVNGDMNVVTGCGLGGTSLINANVALKADPRVFEDGRWPAAFRQDAAGLEEGYRLAWEMLKPVPYPETQPPLKKLAALRKSAEGMGQGQNFRRTDIHVTFEDTPSNHVGVEQKACNGCGNCCSGCNYGAKNATTMNYLPDAFNHGAEIFWGADVRYLERVDGKWVVHYHALETGEEQFDAPTRFVMADIVVLGAGSMGSTAILLRSRKRGLALSDKLGKAFTGNGDFLGFAYNCDDSINGVGWNHKTGSPVGPTITGIIDMRDTPVLDDGLLIEEGAVPGALGAIAPGVLNVAADAIGQGGGGGLAAELRKLESDLCGPYRGAVNHTQTFLVMSHDDGQGEMVLDPDDRLRISWPTARNDAAFQRDSQRLAAATAPLDGVYIKNPLWTDILQRDLITVHPLGGCGMGEDAAGGVVDHRGAVFQGASGTETHPGLYVWDGAVMPRSLGANPLLTISAIAERNVKLLAAEKKWSIDYRLPSAPPSGPIAPTGVGVQFTERMSGFFSTKVTSPGDFQKGYDQGKADGSGLEFTVTIRSNNLDAMLTSPSHEAEIQGTVEGPALSAQPLEVEAGDFHLFTVDPDSVETFHMSYRMPLRTEDGKAYLLEGYKVVRHDHRRGLWGATTTLYVTVRAGDEILGLGILYITPQDFIRQMRTFKITDAPSLAERVEAEARFLKFFSGVLWEAYGGPLASPLPYDPVGHPPHRRDLRAQPEIHKFKTADEVELRLVRFKGGTKGPVIAAGGFGMSSLAWYDDTVDMNFAEFVYGHGYDVWCFDYRSSPALPSGRTQHTIDDIAEFDWPAAVDYVRGRTGAKDVQVMGHCVGSLSTFMAICKGLQGVRDFVSSQLTLHMEMPRFKEFEAQIRANKLFHLVGLDLVTTDPGHTYPGKLIDYLLRFFPVPSDESCTSPVCHRIFSLYGNLYEHSLLNEATHEALDNMFGVANMTAFKQLLDMIRHGYAVDKNGDENAYLPQASRFANVRVTMLAGEKNTFFFPSGSQRTYDYLCQNNPSGRYARHLIPVYSHLDCFIGKNAAADVWEKYVLPALERGN